MNIEQLRGKEILFKEPQTINGLSCSPEGELILIKHEIDPAPDCRITLHLRRATSRWLCDADDADGTSSEWEEALG